MPYMIKYIKSLLVGKATENTPLTPEAENWFRIRAKQAEQGDSFAQAELGMWYESGHGVPQDYSQAMKWYLKAAEQGECLAQIKLGEMYEKQQYHQIAAEWYHKAAEQQNTYAKVKLGQMYERGLGVLQHYAEAHMWYNIAAIDNGVGAITKRDFLAAKMTAGQIEEAQRMAKAWMDKYTVK